MSVQHSTLSLSLSFSLSLPLSVSLYQSFFSPLSLSLSTFEHKIDQSLRKSSETRPTSPWFTQKRPMFPERCSRKSSDSHPKSPTSILFLSLSFPLSFFLSRCFFLSLSVSLRVYLYIYMCIYTCAWKLWNVTSQDAWNCRLNMCIILSIYPSISHIF